MINQKEWESVINDFLKKELEKKEVNYLILEIKKAKTLFKKENKDLSCFNIKTKTDDKLDIELNRHLFLSTASENALHDYTQLKEKLRLEYLPKNWLTVNSKIAKNIHRATHIAKLTHSSSQSISILDVSKETKAGYLTTSSLRKKEIDSVMNSGSYMPIFNFLMLEHENISIFDELKNKKTTLFNAFSDDENEVNNWKEAFRQSLINKSDHSHFLSKQVYFPINNLDYHLLCIINSSSLSHAFFKQFKQAKDSDSRQARKKNTFSMDTVTFFPNVANLKVTRSNHTNVSFLNNKRMGQSFLFPNHPPLPYKKNIAPPIFQKTLFEKISNTAIDKKCIFLKNFLVCYEALDLSIKNPERYRNLRSLIEKVVQEVLNYTFKIQSLKPGWTENEDIMLKIEHQYFLDPHRESESYQKALKASDFEKVIAQDFALWLNFKLSEVNEKTLFSAKAHHIKTFKRLFYQAIKGY